jgi:hypothetical protein
MSRIVVILCAIVTVWLSATVASAQQPAPQPQPARPGTTPPAIAPGDEIKLDESGSLKAAAIQSRMSAILANFALLQRQAQDLQQEMTKALDERKRLLEDAGKKVRVDVREPNEWVYDENGHRYVRSARRP